jgi:hypothetical protein
MAAMIGLGDLAVVGSWIGAGLIVVLNPGVESLSSAPSRCRAAGRLCPLSPGGILIDASVRSVCGSKGAMESEAMRKSRRSSSGDDRQLEEPLDIYKRVQSIQQEIQARPRPSKKRPMLEGSLRGKGQAQPAVVQSPVVKHSIQQEIQAQPRPSKKRPMLEGSLPGNGRARSAVVQSPVVEQVSATRAALASTIEALQQRLRARRRSREEMPSPAPGPYRPDGPQTPLLPGSLVGKERAYLAAVQSGGPEQISATRAALGAVITGLLDTDRDRLGGLDDLPEHRREREFLVQRLNSLKARRDALTNGDEYPAPRPRKW